MSQSHGPAADLSFADRQRLRKHCADLLVHFTEPLEPAGKTTSITNGLYQLADRASRWISEIEKAKKKFLSLGVDCIVQIDRAKSRDEKRKELEEIFTVRMTDPRTGKIAEAKLMSVTTQLANKISKSYRTISQAAKFKLPKNPNKCPPQCWFVHYAELETARTQLCHCLSGWIAYLKKLNDENGEARGGKRKSKPTVQAPTSHAEIENDAGKSPGDDGEAEQHAQPPPEFDSGSSDWMLSAELAKYIELSTTRMSEYRKKTEDKCDEFGRWGTDAIGTFRRAVDGRRAVAYYIPELRPLYRSRLTQNKK